jgi:hypothetical protein
MNNAYILVTPVHNEEKLIGQVIESVAAQTILPKKWIIVDDGSTDDSPRIIKRYENKHAFISYLRFNEHRHESYYSRRVSVVLYGVETTKNLEYDFFGVLDGDITLEKTYYEAILQEFERNIKLGVASGVYVNKRGDNFQPVLIDANHVPGGIQMFRRQCYEEIGGYIPQKYGGDDSCAEIMARMRGWETRSFPKCRVIHHRPTGTMCGTSVIRARFHQGLTEYGIATHPLFMVAKSIRRAVLEKPYFIGSIARLFGFLYGYCMREERRFPPEVIRFVRKEQMRRLFGRAI